MGWRRTPLLRALWHSLAAVSAVLVVSLAAAHVDPTAVVLVSAATLLIAIVALSLTSAAWGEPAGIGRRARAHRQALDSTPEPQHPDTAGRPRTRAPAGRLAAA